jgi:hypothetical protein
MAINDRVKPDQFLLGCLSIGRKTGSDPVNASSSLAAPANFTAQDTDVSMSFCVAQFVIQSKAITSLMKR